MRELLVVRHGETDWNAINRWQGWIDVPLNSNGRSQAAHRAAELAAADVEFVAVASSDLSRAHETATVIASTLGITDHLVDEGFRERFGGDWQGLTRDEINEGWPEQVELWRAGTLAGPPNAETVGQILERFDAAIDRLHAVARPGPVLLVTHGGIQRAVATRAGARMQGVLDNLGGMWFEYQDGRLSLSSTRTDEHQAVHAGPAAE